jgi:integrase
MYAGLRRGELQGLRIEDIDLRRGVINVRHTWDPVAGPLSSTRSRARAFASSRSPHGSRRSSPSISWGSAGQGVSRSAARRSARSRRRRSTCAPGAHGPTWRR